MVLPNGYGNGTFRGQSYRVRYKVLAHARLLVPQTSSSCGLCDPAHRVLTSRGGPGNLARAHLLVHLDQLLLSRHVGRAQRLRRLVCQVPGVRAYVPTPRPRATWARRSASSASVPTAPTGTPGRRCSARPRGSGWPGNSGELSRYVVGSYCLYDFTSSALNQDWPKALNLPNSQRVGTTVYPYPNFGMVEIDWAGRDPMVHLRLHKENGEPILTHRLRLSELRVG